MPLPISKTALDRLGVRLIAKVEEQFEMQGRAARKAPELAVAADMLAGATEKGDFIVGDFIVEDVFSKEFLSEMERWIANSPNPEMISLWGGELQRMTRTQFAEALRQTYELSQRYIDQLAVQLSGQERDLRGILQELADTIGEA
jgi:hypothetical protein